MKANEVIATLAGRDLGDAVHPNDDVNRGQSSNDVMPTAIHISASLALRGLVAALEDLRVRIQTRAQECSDVLKSGRMHLMDAVPMTLGQELSGRAAQIDNDLARLQADQAGGSDTRSSSSSLSFGFLRRWRYRRPRSRRGHPGS